jgi:hypothetical protein
MVNRNLNKFGSRYIGGDRRMPSVIFLAAVDTKVWLRWPPRRNHRLYYY